MSIDVEVILTHENTDFDAVARLLGGKLCLAAIPILVDTQGLTTLKGMGCRFSVHQLTMARDQERG